VNYYLRKQDLTPYFYSEQRQARPWPPQLEANLRDCNAFVLFVGEQLGAVQHEEAATALQKVRFTDTRLLRVDLPKAADVPRSLEGFQNNQMDPIVVPAFGGRSALECARQIVSRLGWSPWKPPDGLPDGHLFDYEKDIIDAFVKFQRGDRGALPVEKGCPAEWPHVRRVSAEADKPCPAPTDLIGTWRTPEDEILVDARLLKIAPDAVSSAQKAREHIFIPTFLEAGPRERHCFPNRPVLNVGILSSGGIAPGMNAVIAAIVERHTLYHQQHAARNPDPRRYALSIRGYREGLAGLLNGLPYTLLSTDVVEGTAIRGGSVLGTSRADVLLDSGDPQERKQQLQWVVNRLTSDQVDILYVIGGDGSMRAAHAIYSVARELEHQRLLPRPLSVVAIPKTMDNDILWVWQSFGFLSAVEKATGEIERLHTEAKSNPRLCIVQLFGSDSGFVASHAALASGVCDAVLIPEITFTMRKLSEYLQTKLLKRAAPAGNPPTSPHGLIIMAETAIPNDALDYLDEDYVGLEAPEKEAIKNFFKKGRRVQGQTPDELRSAGLKIVSRVLQRSIREELGADDRYFEKFRVFCNEPRHLVRAIDPGVSDVVFGRRLGTLAVDNAMAGYTDFMISQWLTEYVLVPLDLVVLGRKRVHSGGIFWKSVILSTGQPSELS
jgi:6-phosphofructokinase 1